MWFNTQAVKPVDITLEALWQKLKIKYKQKHQTYLLNSVFWYSHLPSFHSCCYHFYHPKAQPIWPQRQVLCSISPLVPLLHSVSKLLTWEDSYPEKLQKALYRAFFWILSTCTKPGGICHHSIRLSLGPQVGRQSIFSIGIGMYFFPAGDLEESCFSSPATCLSKGQAKLSTWMDFYALASPVFLKSVCLQICAQFKQHSQLGEYLHSKIYLFYIQLLASKSWGIYFIFYSLGSQGLNKKKSELVSLLRR